MDTLNADQILEINEKIADLVSQGRESEARQYLSEQLPRFPEKLRNEIMTELFVTSIIDEAAMKESIAHIQEEGIRTIETLEGVKEDLKAQMDGSRSQDEGK